MGEGEEVRWQFVTPLNARNEILREPQTKETARHIGINKTLERVNHERVALHLLALVPESDHGNKYIIIVGDYFFFEVDGSPRNYLLHYALFRNYHAVVMREVVQ